MYKFKEDDMNVACYVWSEQGSIEQGAIDQIKNASSLPFVFHHTALMADAHQGYGVSIGSVVALKDVVCPFMVGVDIGCGMCAVKTSLTDIDTDTLKKIMGEIRKVVPVGFNKHKEKQDFRLMPKLEECVDEEDAQDTLFCNQNPVATNEFKNALKSLGTLGGGNHFIEIQKGSDGHIWIMIHSGSRNLGKQIADHYNKIAIELNEKWFSSVPKDWQLAFLPTNSDKGELYIEEMNYAVEFALANRKLMMNRIKDIFQGVAQSGRAGDLDSPGCRFKSCLPDKILFDEMINIAHNYASLENHFGENVWVHRKGATQAREGQLGIIPGSQGSKSYIVKGKGNKESFESCSHGAGRKMGRKQAERELDLEKELKILDEQGIIHGIRGQKDLDEASGAYKDISEVMDNQKDLVDIEVELTPLAVIKG